MGDIIFECLRMLKYTGFDIDRLEFNVLWMQMENMDLDRVALNPSRHSWVQTLRDGQNTCAMAVLVESCYGVLIDGQGGLGQLYQQCHARHRFKLPSRLETALEVNESHVPFKEMRKVKPGDHRLECAAGGVCRRPSLNRPFYDVSYIKQGEYIYIAEPHYRLTVVKALSEQHLLLEWNPSIRQALWNTVMFTPVRGKGHLEQFEKGSDTVLVHIQHSS